jgi:hypothetical protein
MEREGAHQLNSPTMAIVSPWLTTVWPSFVLAESQTPQ